MNPFLHVVRITTLSLLLAGQLAGQIACRVAIAPPYAPGQAPALEHLLATTQPSVESISAPHANLRLDTVIRANLMFIAQAPMRFSGQVHVAGKEIATLAIHEHGYALRYLIERGLSPGYYAGPPSGCAVEQLLGVPLDPPALVRLMLGGAPVLAPPFELLSRAWDRKTGEEVVRIANANARQELRFAWIRDRFVVSGETHWARTTNGELRRRWSFSHEGFVTHEGVLLAQKTRIEHPEGRRIRVVVLDYGKRVINPFRAVGTGEPGSANDGWNDSDEGWEDDEQPEGDPQAAREEQPAPHQPVPEAKTGARSGPEPELPTAFRLDAGDLPKRGDLCRRP